MHKCVCMYVCMYVCICIYVCICFPDVLECLLIKNLNCGNL